jgi:chemosensory pili system protein ChpA (sensor histidine kinase/response regulator)
MRLMQEKLMRIRMTPMSSLSRVLFRTVRETARKLAKKANLVIVGEDVFMDRFVWAKITDPLMHILRNALDHGIESPEERIAAGKPESGTIHLEANQRSRFVVLRISDDGGGIDIAKVKEKVRRSGFAENPESLSEKELLEYLFHPSFTTRQDITTISGRGIGLDVVRRNIQDLHGSVQLFNNPGQGVTFELRIPFTLSVNRAIMVSVAGRVFAVPLQDIQQVKRFASVELEEGDGVFLRQGADAIPVVNLGFCLQLERKMTGLPSSGQGILAILFHKEEKLFAVSVDEVVEQREIIVKSLGSHLTHVPGISGVTFTGSGELIPIVNLREIIDVRKPVTRIEVEQATQIGVMEPLKVLIVDDSISVRHSVARLVESQGWKQLQAFDGIDALDKLEIFMPDVIVLDIEMPRMNGYEFKSNLNNNVRLKDIPVVMLTSRASEKHQQKAKDLGVQHYMTKPYQEEAFIRLLDNIRSGYVH